MNFKLLFIFISILLQSYLISAQSDCACCTNNHDDFDFWIGDWMVYDTTGNVIGENQVIQLEDHCIINENWTGNGGVTGKSYNYYNAIDSTWNQLWLDNKGSNLILKGKAEEGKMIMRSELQKGTNVAWYMNRITWTLNADQSVTQQWDILDEEGKLLRVAFVGIYRRK